MEILPPSDEGGGQREALDGGREKQYCLRNLRIVRILSSSLPQSASQTAPSSDGAKAANNLFRQTVIFSKEKIGAVKPAPTWLG